MHQKTFDSCTLPQVYFPTFDTVSKKKDKQEEFIYINSAIEKRDDQEWTTTAQEYKDVTKEIKALEKRQKQLRDALILMSEHQNSTGGGVLLEKCVRRGSVLYSEIPQLKGVDLNEYRGDLITYWKVTEV